MEHVLLKIMRTTLTVLVLVLAGCGATARDEARGPAVTVDAGIARPDTISQPSAPALSRQADKAFALLVESAAESCAVCARDLRRKAFIVLDEKLTPGTRVSTDSTTRFVRATGNDGELEIAPPPDGAAHITFRFHTAADHLVGIGEGDYTAPALAARISSAPAGTLFRGTVEIVPFAYGDGDSWLYLEKENRVQAQCRILEIDRDGPRTGD